jgi:hypothetical protein
VASALVASNVNISDDDNVMISKRRRRRRRRRRMIDDAELGLAWMNG